MKLLATKTVVSDIPISILSFMFSKVSTLDNRDYLQVFDIKSNHEELNIIHTTEEPRYEKKYALPFDMDIEGNIFAVIEDNYCTFMYADEY